MGKLHLREDLDLFTLDGYFQFSCSREDGILRFLKSYIVRATEGITDNYKNCREEYKKFLTDGKLVARWPQKQMAKKLKVTQPTVSKSINKLVEYGFVKKINRSVDINTQEVMTYYHLGNFTDNIGEIRKEVFFDEVIWQKMLDDKEAFNTKYNKS